MQQNYQQILKNITLASAESDKNNHTILLIAVSKKQSIQKIVELYNLGVKNFAESYVQEAIEKKNQLKDLPITWHFIGPIQSNKIKLIAQNFSWVHSVDSIKIIDGLAKYYQGQHPLNILLQINIDDSPSKRGINPSEALYLVEYISKYSNLKLRGFMTIPEPDHANQAFRDLKVLFDKINSKISNKMDQLSMGMSQDYPEAIKNGSTMLRIGSSLFGVRS